MNNLPSEFEPQPIAPQPVLEGPLAALLEWHAMAEGAYSENTLRAQKADGAIFQAFCERRGHAYLPAEPKTIRAFIEHAVKLGKKPATIKRYVATIARVHIAAKLLNPCSSEAVRLGLKQMGRETTARQDQAHPLGWKEIKEFIDSAGEGLRADRERALLCVAYETLARRGELVALQVRDLDLHPDGTGQALIRRGKTDAAGQGRVAYLSRETVRWLKIWLEAGKVSDGALFRRLIGRNEIGGPLNSGSIAPIFKRVAQWIGMPARYVAMVSGHSTRVGATQDLAALDIDLAAITQAGGWKSTRMPLQYADKINAARSGMARAAKARLFHFASAEHATSAVALQRLKIARISELNDPFEVIPAALRKKTHRRALENLRDTLATDTGLLCFSEKWDHPLMWSHYANRHRGICLGFDVSQQLIDEVSYSRQRLRIEWENEGAGKVTRSFMKSLLITKADYWSYESEFRAFIQLDDATREHGLYYYPFDTKIVLAEIIRGPLCELPTDRLKKLVQAIDPTVNIVDTVLAAKTFTILQK